MAELVTTRYATALFDIAKAKDAVEQFEDEVKTILKILNEEKEFIQILAHPQILQDEKIKVIENVFEGKVSQEIVGLLVLIVRKNRQEILLDILSQFIEMAEVEKGILRATITTAMPLDDKQLAQIKTRLENNTQKTIELDVIHDKALIGGMIIKLGDKVVDGSIAGKMQALKQQLMDLRLA